MSEHTLKLTRSQAVAILEHRGYSDVDPEREEFLVTQLSDEFFLIDHKAIKGPGFHSRIYTDGNGNVLKLTRNHKDLDSFLYCLGEEQSAEMRYFSSNIGVLIYEIDSGLEGKYFDEPVLIDITD